MAMATALNDVCSMRSSNAAGTNLATCAAGAFHGSRVQQLTRGAVLDTCAGGWQDLSILGETQSTHMAGILALPPDSLSFFDGGAPGAVMGVLELLASTCDPMASGGSARPSNSSPGTAGAWAADPSKAERWVAHGVLGGAWGRTRHGRSRVGALRLYAWRTSPAPHAHGPAWCDQPRARLSPLLAPHPAVQPPRPQRRRPAEASSSLRREPVPRGRAYAPRGEPSRRTRTDGR